MWKNIIVRSVIAGHGKTSVRLTCRWPTTRMLLQPSARQTYMYVCFTIIVIHKYGSNEHRALRVATGLQTKLYVTPTTGTSDVHLPYVALSITSTQFLTLRSDTCTGAKTCKTRSTRTITKHERPVVTAALVAKDINFRGISFQTI